MTEQDEKFRIYETIAKQIEREDGLINYRLSWMLQINGFLFAAIALLGGSEKEQNSVTQIGGAGHSVNRSVR